MRKNVRNWTESCDVCLKGKLLKETCSWLINKKRTEPRQVINGALKRLWKYCVLFVNRCLIEGILYQRHQIEPNFGTACNIMVPGERVTNVLELLQRAGYFRIEKTYQMACEKFHWPWKKNYGIAQKAVTCA